MTNLQSHTKNDFFWWEKVGKHMTFLQAANHWTCDCLCLLPSQTRCIFTTVCIRREDSAQLPMGDAMVHGKAINCIPRGNYSNRPTSDRGREETTNPRKDCVPRQRVSFRHHPRCHADLWCGTLLMGWAKVKTFLKCQGHMTFLSARGTWHF